MALVVGVLAVDRHAWFDWNRRRLIDAIRYGAGMQLSTLGQLLFDPVVKALLARVGALSVVGYYEIAIRFVTQCRSVIAAAYQALIPYLAHRAGDRELAKGDIVRAYRLAHSLLVAIALPFFSVVAVALPLVFDIWLGRHDATFIAIGLACLAGFCVNTLSISAYVIYLAIGRIRWTIWTQFGIGVLNVALASIGSRVFGVGGVVAGSMIALALGSTIATIAFHVEFSAPWRAFVPKGSLRLAVLAVTGASMIVGVESFAEGRVPQLPFAVVLGLFCLLCAINVWRQPAVVDAVGRLRAAQARA
jgi:O-antigen/teichoic acid export membrane protein